MGVCRSASVLPSTSNRLNSVCGPIRTKVNRPMGASWVPITSAPNTSL